MARYFVGMRVQLIRDSDGCVSRRYGAAGRIIKLFPQKYVYFQSFPDGHSFSRTANCEVLFDDYDKLETMNTNQLALLKCDSDEEGDWSKLKGIWQPETNKGDV